MERSLGGEVYAIIAMVGHVPLLKDFFGPFARLNQGLVVLGDCKIPFPQLETRKAIADKFLARRFLIAQQALEVGEQDNGYWLPGTGNPADGLTKVRSDLAPLLRLLDSGGFPPGHLRPLKGLFWRE